MNRHNFMITSLGNIVREPMEWEINYKDVIAWFTAEIPLSYGPKHYKGLPGLIIQIEYKEYTLTATKINLNPSEEIKIKRLGKNDKIISQQESFNRIREMTTNIEKRMSRNR